MSPHEAAVERVEDKFSGRQASFLLLLNFLTGGEDAKKQYDV